MVIKLYISGISASKEVKKRQQRAQMLLDSLRIKYEIIDITEPGHESEKELMKNVCKKRNNNSVALPPQFFNDDQYCGDYEDFELASDDDLVLSFLKLEEDITIENGDLDEGNNDLIEMNDTPVLNGENKVEINEDKEIYEEVIDETVEEVVTVEEKLTLGGKVIDIPLDGKFEIKGNKIDLNELLFSKTKKLEESEIVKENEELNVENSVENNDSNDSQMDVEENNETNREIEEKDAKVEENKSKSNEEEDEEEDNNESED